MKKEGSKSSKLIQVTREELEASRRTLEDELQGDEELGKALEAVEARRKADLERFKEGGEQA
ncbi:MAG: hypothetical protein ACE5JL_18385 [Dehalococcoidia bacterium]